MNKRCAALADQVREMAAQMKEQGAEPRILRIGVEAWNGLCAELGYAPLSNVRGVQKPMFGGMILEVYR